MEIQNSSDYIGITIGPIVDTLMLSSSPAGLWGASYLFSYIARNLTEKLIAAGVEETEFVCPVVDEETKQIRQEAQGVGLFHDRIIFRAKAGEMKVVQDSIKWIKTKVADQFYENLKGDPEEREKYQEFMNSCLQIHAVKASVMENDNPILQLGKLLDALELMKTVNTKENENYILKMLVNQGMLNEKAKEDGDSEKGKNFYIKQSFLAKDAVQGDNWKLMENGRIKNISDIAKNEVGAEKLKKKKYQYYAFVQSDGDNLTKILRNIINFSQEKEVHTAIREFSKTCFRYSQKAAERIHKYGGVTIYAGGDDLLFLAPLEGKEQDTIFDLIQELDIVFKTEFKEYLKDGDGMPSGLSVSFGVAIHHEGYPLYESLNRAYMLLVKAKEGDKHGLAVELMKHSGQANGIYIKRFSKNETYLQMLDLFHEIRNLDEKFLRSLTQKFALHEQEIKMALEKSSKRDSEKVLQNLVENLFSNRHKDIFIKGKDNIEVSLTEERKYIREITMLFYNLEKKKEIVSLNQNKQEALECLDAIIRIMKFYQEERGDA